MKEDRAYLRTAFDLYPGQAASGSTGFDAQPDSRWKNSKCPGMLCVRSVSFDYLPSFCTLTDTDEVCPYLQCHQYIDTTSCEVSPHRHHRPLLPICRTPACASVGGGGARGGSVRLCVCVSLSLEDGCLVGRGLDKGWQCVRRVGAEGGRARRSWGTLEGGCA